MGFKLYRCYKKSYTIFGHSSILRKLKKGNLPNSPFWGCVQQVAPF